MSVSWGWYHSVCHISITYPVNSLKMTVVSPDITSIFEGGGVEQVSGTAPAGSWSFLSGKQKVSQKCPNRFF